MDVTGPSCKQDKTTLKTKLILYSKQMMRMDGRNWSILQARQNHPED